jgi:hypothetical protein
VRESPDQSIKNSPPWRQEAATLEAAWQTYRSQGVQLIGVNVWDGEDDACRFLQEFAVTYPNGPAPSDLSIEYGLRVCPKPTSSTVTASSSATGSGR